MTNVTKFDDKKTIAFIKANLKAQQPKTEFIHVSPAVATFLLELKWDGNRKISQHHVNAYATAMREGSWDVTGQGLSLSTDGDVIDGQHRLWAVLESGATIKTSITFGIEPEAFRSFDRGMNRTLAYCAQMGTQKSGALNFILKIGYGSQESNVANVQAMERVYGDAVDKVLSLQSKQLRVVRQAGVVAAAAIWIKAGREMYASDVYAALINLDTGSLPPIGKAFLRQCVMAMPVTGNKQIGGLQLFLRAFKTFDPSMSEVSRIAVKDGTPTLDMARSMIEKAVTAAGVTFGRSTVETKKGVQKKRINA